MSVKCLILCLFALVFIEVNSQVCTRTFTATFSKSGNDIKNFVQNPPTLTLIKNCCPGYYIANPQEEASSANCLKLCKLNCTTGTCVDEHCVCPEGFIKDTTGTVCIQKCDPGFNYVNGICQQRKDLSDKKKDSDVVHDKVNCSESTTSCQNTSFEAVFYVSATTNIILLLIIVIVLTKCKTCARDNKNNAPGHRDAYADMDGTRRNPVRFTKNEAVPENTMPGCSDQYVPMCVNQHHLADPPQYESIQYSAGARESLCYDYVQTPLPIHLRKAMQGVPRRG